ncbi:hypothetical protein SAMN05192559_101452 [Halobacillus karajensis]|uniref:Uncharacterized protein n=1 Tax=Halobacillus karajensis TaxID=195088 RepID=A0A059NWY3_9BACI|nr:hypothetical protein BN982_01192 [Halobacillus karajensis]CDQ23016.1 hypothetical protein BN983_01235 [Halobacillus karajensis]CDQ26498.1 hypothetical protein BN981_00715 [Halobacillus karajensis]SEH44476.1 hypothetical protein SAMN05192559_101452 [Halobacillus karajensis]
MENLKEVLQNIIQQTEDSELLSSKDVINQLIEQLQQ